MKGQIMAEINSQLSELGIMPVFGMGTDIVITAEFLDASWGSGSRKIDYEALIYLDSARQTAFMYEKTVDIDKGFSFGSSSESSFQFGPTLYRKVKSVQYGLDGKAYELRLNLGAIPKSIRKVVRLHGWKFKIVLKKSLALYPDDATPSHGITGQPGSIREITTRKSQQYIHQNIPNIPIYASSATSFSQAAEQPHAIASRAGLILLAMIALLTFVIYLMMSTSLPGFLMGATIITIAGHFLKRQNRGILTVGILILLTVVTLFAILIATTPL